MAEANALRRGAVFEAKALEERSKLDTVWPKVDEPWANRLNVLTYYEEILECEAFWPGEGRDVLQSGNSAAVKEEIGDLARWCWNERFFRLPRARKLAAPLLGAIREMLAQDTAQDSLAIHSAHDYTIMSLLAALGVESYPSGGTIGYGSYIVFWDDGNVEVNLRPFEESAPTTVVEKLTMRLTM
ncbi:Prostatic acid phosphatase [Durusdinium trenchii]|uniref:Prostatic acid phosphatase n=1 Tax=Durusdinium trenchii TaxID=1381693 RepID=A0ABP0LR43_9DINO